MRNTAVPYLSSSRATKKSISGHQQKLGPNLNTSSGTAMQMHTPLIQAVDYIVTQR
jgi:hypothetical protein